MQLERIVIATDFSEPAAAAAEWTARHFAPHSEIVLVHVIDSPEHRGRRGGGPANTGDAAAQRQQVARRLGEEAASLGIERFVTDVRVGRPGDEIARACDEHHAGVVVVGKHARKRGLLGILGSTAEELVRRSHVPVLLAAEQRDAAPAKLVVAVSESHVAPWVVQWARFLMRRFDASATALYVIGASVFTSALSEVQVGESASESLPENGVGELVRSPDDWLSRLLGSDADRHPFTVDVIFGDPAEEIVATAARLDADMIVMGSRGMGKLGSAILGSVAGGVLRQAPCPVLVVKEPEDEVLHVRE